jgi:hypothetical protein
MMYFVSVTRLRLHRPWVLPAFVWNNWLTLRQAARIPGFVGGKLLADAHNVYWTMTVWEKQSAMKQLRDDGAHRRVMPRINDWCDEASVVHWEQPTPDLPTFAVAHGRMVAAGHFTPLQRPTSAHIARAIAPPASEQTVLPIHPVKGLQAA